MQHDDAPHRDPAPGRIGTAEVSAAGLPAAGAPVEYEIGLHIAKRGLLVAPAIVAVCWLIWGADGARSAGVGLALIVANFLLSALLVSTAARISLGLMMGAVLFGYVLRLGLVFLVVTLVRDQPWISLPALGATIIVTHLGLLFWELRHLAINLAHPGLAPKRP